MEQLCVCARTCTYRGFFIACFTALVAVPVVNQLSSDICVHIYDAISTPKTPTPKKITCEW